VTALAHGFDTVEVKLEKRRISPVGSPIHALHQPRNVLSYEVYDWFVLLWDHRINSAWLS
jgi:hypothetical protein